MYYIYNIGLIIYWLINLPRVIKRLLFEDGYAKRLFESIGRMSDSRKETLMNRSPIWIHAASVGEIVAAGAVAKELKIEMPNQNIMVSVVTATGYDMAKKIIKEADNIIFFPLDLPFATKRILRIVKPIAIVIVETEIWPNFIKRAYQQQIPIIFVNGRISDRSIKKYRKVKFFMKSLLEKVTLLCMQSQHDAHYIEEMGADPAKVIVTGNTKYDFVHPEFNENNLAELKQIYNIAEDDFVIVAGSTHEGEEKLLLQAYVDLLKIKPQAKFIIAPRDIGRRHELLNLCLEFNLKAELRSNLSVNNNATKNIIILDSIGELGKVYALASFVFVGGSLVPIGGHNILEAAIFEKPIIVGEHMFNFKDIYHLLNSSKAIITVHGEDELRNAFTKLASDEAYLKEISSNCRNIIEPNRGAARRNVQEIKKVLLTNKMM